MKRKITGICIVILLLSAAPNPLPVLATSYMPTFFYHQQDIKETVMKAGQTVYLFHSGTEDVKRAIRDSYVLIVYRINPSCEAKMVGKIRVISYIGDIYLKGKIIEGEIRPNDIAKKGSVSCLVISAVMCNTAQ